MYIYIDAVVCYTVLKHSLWEYKMPRLIAVRFRYHMQGRNLDNNLTFEEVDPPTTPINVQQWTEDFADSFLPVVSALQCWPCTYGYLDVKDLRDPTWFYRLDLSSYTPNGGSVESEGMPYYVAFHWTLNRSTLAGGFGHFRLRGMGEVMQINGVRAIAFQEEIQAVTDWLGATFTDSASGDYLIRILERTRVPSNPSLPFESWTYTPRPVAGIVYTGITHKVQN